MFEVTTFFIPLLSSVFICDTVCLSGVQGKIRLFGVREICNYTNLNNKQILFTFKNFILPSATDNHTQMTTENCKEMKNDGISSICYMSRKPLQCNFTTSDAVTLSKSRCETIAMPIFCTPIQQSFLFLWREK